MAKRVGLSIDFLTILEVIERASTLEEGEWGLGLLGLDRSLMPFCRWLTVAAIKGQRKRQTRQADGLFLRAWL